MLKVNTGPVKPVAPVVCAEDKAMLIDLHICVQLCAPSVHARHKLCQAAYSENQKYGQKAQQETDHLYAFTSATGIGAGRWVHPMRRYRVLDVLTL